MKNALKLLSVTFAAGLAGVAFAEIASVSRLAPVQGETLLALFVTATIVLIMATDYSRTSRRLTPLPSIGRPSLPSSLGGPARRSAARRAAA